MNLIEQYSLASGSKIDKPFIFTKYFPLLVDKYITIHTTSKGSKSYDYWQEVVDILFPILKEQGIAIVQIGAKNETPLNKAYVTLGQTSVNQVAYILDHALLHVGVDSFPAHIAGGFDKKLVAIYSNSNIDNVRPYWGKKENQILLEPDRKGNKPNYSLEENPKTINTIKPELIAESVCKLLGIEWTYPYKTVEMGETYFIKIVESVLNNVVDASKFGVASLIVRYDILANPQFLVEQLKVCPCTIITNKPVPEEVLKRFRFRIVEVIYFIEPNYSVDFLKTIQKNRIKYRLVSRLPKEQLDKYKLDLMDFGLIIEKEEEQPKTIDFKNIDNLYYKSNKFLLSNGQIFQSKYDYINCRPIFSLEPTVQKLKIDNISQLWQDKDYLCFIEKS